MKKKPVIILIGTFDTKGDIFGYLYDRLKSDMWSVIAIDMGTQGSNTHFPIDFDSSSVAQFGGKSLSALVGDNLRNQVIEVMGRGAAKLIHQLNESHQIIGIIGAGGGGGTYMALQAMQAVPFGIPKICISTMAAKDLSTQVGTKDIILVPSVVDVSNLNSIIQPILDQSAAAIRGMSSEYLQHEVEVRNLHRIAISMFGNTTPCVENCIGLLDRDQFEVFTFHATGTGGMTMESLIREGLLDGVIDVTITELADFLCGGVCDAGPERLEAAVDVGLPQVVVPGCLDMVNFTYPDLVPVHYRDRNLYQWSPDVTLMRTNAEENVRLGEMIMSKLNKTRTPIYVVLPLRGLSAIDKEGSEFHDPAANIALFESIKQHKISDLIQIIDLDLHINDKKFSEQLVNYYFRLIHQKSS